MRVVLRLCLSLRNPHTLSLPPKIWTLTASKLRKFSPQSSSASTLSSYTREARLFTRPFSTYGHSRSSHSSQHCHDNFGYRWGIWRTAASILGTGVALAVALPVDPSSKPLPSDSRALVATRECHDCIPIYQQTIVPSSENATPHVRTLFGVVVAVARLPVRAIRLTFRIAFLAVVFAPLALSSLTWVLRASLPPIWWTHLLVSTLEFAGPAFIKLGQWCSSRTDVFDPVVCRALAKLQSGGTPHSFRATETCVRKMLDADIYQVFTEFDEQPIGVGAIAQVHKAQLKSTGEVVAVKVLHPGVEDSVKTDLAILRIIAHIFSYVPWFKWVSPVEECAAFSNIMQAQLDLRNEALHLHIFDNNFARRCDVVIPEPKWELTRSALLVEQYHEGVPLTQFLLRGPNPEIDHKLAALGLDAFLRMLVTDNFVHADMHPGNIYVTFVRRPWYTRIVYSWSQFFSFKVPLHSLPPKAAKEAPPDIIQKLRSSQSREEFCAHLAELGDYEPQLVLLDAGLVSVLSEENQRNFLDLFHAVASFNGYEAGELLITRSRTPETVRDAEGFKLKFAACLDRVRERTLMLSRIRISDILSEALDNVRSHYVRLEGEFVNTVIAILLLEGIGRQLDPGIDLLRAALPVLREGRKDGGTTFGLSDKLFWDALYWQFIGKPIARLKIMLS